MAGGFAGAIAGPVLRAIVEQIRVGTIRLPGGLRTGFEGYECGYSDYLIPSRDPRIPSRPMSGYHLPESGLMNDYLVSRGSIQGTDLFEQHGRPITGESIAI